MHSVPDDEQARLQWLRQYRTAGAEVDVQLRHIAEAAAALFGAPVALITLVDADRVWVEASVGLDVREAPRDGAFCDETILHDMVTVVPDARDDARFQCHPIVRDDPGVRFYAGVPLRVADGLRVGTLCVMDIAAREALSPQDAIQLEALAAVAVDRLATRGRRNVNTAVRGFADATSEALLCIDGHGIITFVNAAALALFGYAAEEMIGQTLDLIVPERFRGSHAAGVTRVGTGAPSKLAGKTVELSAVRRSGEEFPIEIGICTWKGLQGIQMGAFIRDISERKERDLRLHRMASQDALTGLANRPQLERALAEAYASAAPVAVLLLDLDGFKGVNDSLGHAAGDALLQAVAIRLQAALDSDAVLSRMGGDEFAVVLPVTGDPLRLHACAKGILSAMEAPFRVLGHSLQMGISIGAAIAPNHGADAEELIASADLALYRAKAEGRQRFRLFEPAMRNAIQIRRALQDDLRRAVEGGELVLYYQPQVDLATGLILGAEALLRWQHPERGLVLPAAFVPVLETHVLAAEVGNWVLNEACRQTAQWRAQGLGRLRMGVNLFAAQIRSGLLGPTVVAALARHGLHPADLELEITETIALQNDEAVLGPLRSMQHLGVALAFDDFGTGYASLSTLKRVPLATLKIDRSFVRDLQSDAQDAAVVEAVIGMGRRLGLNVIAEGIETPEQENLLLAMGCRAGQGFLYGRPMPAEALAQRLAEQARGAAVRVAI